MHRITPETTAAPTGKRKKVEWFKEKYGSADASTGRSVKQKVICKFFSTTGRCRNGDTCSFIHEGAAAGIKLIAQPCKFLYTGSFRCTKGDLCHVSHDAPMFPCPHKYAGVYGVCRPMCAFDHTPIDTEGAAMRFVELYHSLLTTMGGQVNQRWLFYLQDYTTMQLLHRQTRTDPTNPFRFQVGDLRPWETSSC